MKHYEEEEFVEYKSRSQRKRESDAVEDLAQFLTEMTASQVKALPVEQEIRGEVSRTQGIRNLAARRRQTKFVARLLRGMEEEELETLETHVSQLRQTRVRQVENFHHIEVWRDRLCEEGAAGIDALARAYPGADLSPLRDAVRRLQQTHWKHEYRLVFQLLRGVMGEKTAR